MDMNLDQIVAKNDSLIKGTLPEVPKGSIGIMAVCNSLNKNTIGLAFASFVSTADNEIGKIFSPNQIDNPGRVLYISIGDPEFNILNKLLPFIDEKTKNLFQENLSIESLPPGLSEKLESSILDIFHKQKRTPDLIVINSAQYLKKGMYTSCTNEAFKTVLWSLANTTKASIVLITTDEISERFIEESHAWVVSIEELEESTELVPLFACSAGTENSLYESIFSLRDNKPEVVSTETLYSHSVEINLPEEHLNENGHTFIKSYHPYEYGTKGSDKFGLILDNLSPEKKANLVSFNGGKESLLKIEQEINTEFPWFSRITAWVLQNIRGRMFLKSDNEVLISLPPLLIFGPPGIGKTEWAAELAKKIGIPFEVLALGGTAHGVEYITSLSRNWETPKPSRILSFVAETKTANPLFLLDEIDKQGTNNEHGTVQQILLSYLDRNASNLYDDFIEGYLDVTKLNFVATANDLSKIDEPLLSRFEVVEAERPNQEHAKPIFDRMIKRFGENMNIEQDKIPHDKETFKIVQNNLAEGKDLRKVWSNVRTNLLKNITGVEIHFPNKKTSEFGFDKNRF